MEKVKIQILEYFKGLEFEEVQHKYVFNSKPIKISVSGLIKNYYKPFDSYSISLRIAERDGISQEEVLKGWDDEATKGINKGNKAHLFGEVYPFNRNLEPKDKYEEAIVKFWNDLPDTIVPVIMELRMFHKEFMFAGTADILLYNTVTGMFIIGDYKGLPLDTPILTTEGWKNMEDLTIFDKVYDKEGLPTKIKAVSEIHNKKCLQINFDNNENIISDFEHRWLISFCNSGTWKDKVMTTQELKKYIEEKTNVYGQNIPSCYIPKILNSKPLNIEEKKLPIDPYVLGIWLGDGHKADSKITQMNTLVWKEIEKRGYKIGNDVSKGGAGKAKTCTIFNIHSQLKKLNLLFNKHLPKEYLLSSYEQRLDLLRGFMDADGYYNKKRKRYVIATTKQIQVDIAVELLASLGIKTTVISCKKYCNNKIFDGWDVCFTTDKFNPFLNRNQDIKIKTNNQNSYRRILNIEEVSSVPTKCIEVESKSHTFLAGKSLIVTHNTNKDLFKNFKEQKMLGPFDNMLDCAFNKYQLQLSYYQILFEQTGLKVSSRKLIWLLPDGTYKMYNMDNHTGVLKQELKTIKL